MPVQQKWGISEALLPCRNPEELAKYRRVLISCLMEAGQMKTATKLAARYGTRVRVGLVWLDAWFSQAEKPLEHREHTHKLDLDPQLKYKLYRDPDL